MKAPRATRPKKARSKHHPGDAPEGRRCVGTVRSTGQRCKRRAIKGSTVCPKHGGSAPQIKAAAKQRVVKAEAEKQAQRMVELDGVDLDPIDHLLDSLHRAAQLVKVWGSMCAEIDNAAEEELIGDKKIRGELGYSVSGGKFALNVQVKDRLLALNKHGEAQLHPYMVEYVKALDSRAKMAKMCIDAGIAEMQMQLIERQVDMAQEALEATLDDLKLSPEQRQLAMHSHARHLRAAS